MTLEVGPAGDAGAVDQPVNPPKHRIDTVERGIDRSVHGDIGRQRKGPSVPAADLLRNVFRRRQVAIEAGDGDTLFPEKFGCCAPDAATRATRKRAGSGQRLSVRLYLGGSRNI